MTDKYRAFILLLCLVGCNPARRAERLVDKAMRIDAPSVVNKITPAVITQTRVVRDTLREKEVIRIKEEIIRRGDSIRLTVPADCEAMRRKLDEANEFIEGLQSLLNDLPVVTDTIYTADTGRIWRCEYERRKLASEMDAEKGKRIRDLRMFLLLIILALLGFIAYQFKRK